MDKFVNDLDKYVELISNKKTEVLQSTSDEINFFEKVVSSFDIDNVSTFLDFSNIKTGITIPISNSAQIIKKIPQNPSIAKWNFKKIMTGAGSAIKSEDTTALLIASLFLLF